MSSSGPPPIARGPAQGTTAPASRGLGSLALSARPATAADAQGVGQVDMTDGNDFAASTALQPLAPPPRTSSREPSLSGDGSSARKAGSPPEPDASGQTLGVPVQAPPQGSSTGLSGDTANEPSESIGRGSKRSLTGRKREASAGSKHSARAAAGLRGKVPRPGSAGQSQAAGELHSKKKGGLLAFLNCCAAKDEGPDEIPPEAVQPPKPVPKQQPVRAQQPLSVKQHQDVSAAGTSMTGSETLDEKTPSSQPNAHTAEPVIPALDSEKLHHGDTAVDKPVSKLPADVPRPDSNREMRLLDQQRQPAVPAEATASPLHLDTSAAGGGHETPEAGPYVQVQAPTPVVLQSEEEKVISDRTPQQAAVDEDLEMQDREPLTSDEAAVVAGGALALGSGAAVAAVEEERHRRESRESSRDHSNPELPPPPPGPPPPNEETHINTGDGKIPSHQSSIASDREEHKQWLLPPLKSELHGRKCLVLDLDETLVHSSFKVFFPLRLIVL